MHSVTHPPTTGTHIQGPNVRASLIAADKIVPPEGRYAAIPVVCECRLTGSHSMQQSQDVCTLHVCRNRGRYLGH